MATSVTPTLETPIPATGSVIIEHPEKKKKKKKYSRGLGDLQRFDRGLAKASKRINEAVADGFTKYLKESDKSARKRRDGAIQDALENWALAMGKTMRRASTAPVILASTVNTRSARKQFRALVRLTTLPISR